jgi:alpha-tubulin suppressor-like RCC1 family protein
VVSWGYQTDVPASATNIIAIAAGWGHNLALRADGTILGWGDNTFGQAAIPSSATNVIAVSAGWYHSMALRKDGTLISWGKVFKRSFITNTPAGLTNIASIDAGEDFSAVVVQTGLPCFNLPTANLSIAQGGQLFYRPSIQGSLPMTYQWIRNGVIIDGQTNISLWIPIAQISDGGSYQLIASNLYGSVTNAVVTYNVSGNPKFYSAVGAWGSDIDGQCDVAPVIINPKAVAAGAFHNLVLQGDGSIVAWGKNWNGQTNVPTGTTNAISVAAGSDHSLALRSNGSVIAWGRNSDGQTNVPAAATNVVAIAAGWAHSLALRADGTVIAWGNNDYGQTNTPQNLTDVIAITAGYYHNLALRSDHSLVSWGSQYTVPASVTNAVAISAGWEHNLALTSDGKVIGWGDNSYGQSSVPAIVKNATAIEAGFGHSMVRLSDGTIVAWGKNYIGVTNVPADLKNVAMISCGEDHELAMVGYGPPQIQSVAQTSTPHLGGNGFLAANLQGTFPLSCQWYHDASPVTAATNSWLLLTNLQSADAGLFTLIVSNNAGQSTSAPLNYGVDAAPYFLTPLPTQQNDLIGNPLCLTLNAEGMPPLAYQSQLNGANIMDNGRISGARSPNLCFNPTAFEDSGLLTLTVTNDFGSYTGLVANLAITPVIGWGDDSSGQLQVPATTTNVLALASGGDHNLALLADGSVTAWGDNTFNQNTVTPFANQVFAIAEGDTHSLALKADGSVIAWGDNSSGQTNVPGTVQNAVAIAAGTRFSQALMPDGSIIQWGASHIMSSSFTNVMLLSTKGTHTMALRADGTVVDTLQASVSETNVISICAGKSDSLVLRTDGSLVAWGKNYYGQTNIPAAATNIIALAAGEDHFVALRADGIVIAWGSTNFSQTRVPALTQSIGIIAAGSVHSLAVLGQPFQRMAKLGEAITFSAGALANRLATYQWQFNGADIPGATNSTFMLGNAYWANSGIYRVIISNTLGSVTSPAMTLSVPPFKLDVVALNMLNTNGAFQIRLTGSSGLNPVIFYTSSNLLNWQSIFTNPPTDGTIDFTDMPPTGTPQRFYRAVEQP